MGILKISDQLHDDIRSSSKAMSRSINAQAEFWIRLGKLCETNPSLSYNEILQRYLLTEDLASAQTA
ncbi:ParD-like family protein [Arenicella chitinivorans]|nr:ParD-like family protein [Arenicella chitinivorans]